MSDELEGGSAVPEASTKDRATPPTEDSATPDEDANVADAGIDAGDSAVVDTGTDTGVDAGPTTRLFFGGDFAVNNTSAVGRALAPAGASAPATAVILAKASAWALSVDGTKIAFVADLTVAGRGDLYVANADGTSPTMLYAAPAATVVITDLAFSPNGTKIAFMADVALDGQNDVYVVAAAGGAAPVQVSPARAANNANLDAQVFSWSRTSTHLAIAGDFTEDQKNELYTVDVSGAAPVLAPALAVGDIPVPVAGSVGISTGLRPIWTAGNKVCAKVNLNAAAPSFRLYCANANGTAFAQPTNFPSLPAQLGSFGLSPDGTVIAFSADSAAQRGAYEVFTMLADDSAASTRISSGTFTAAATTSRGVAINFPIAFSPDATKIAFVGDVLVDDRNELYVLPAAGGVAEKRLAVVGPAADAERDVTAFAWAPDGSAIAFIADHRANNDFELFRVLNVTAADQVPSLVRGVAASGDIFDLDWRP